MKSLKKMFSFVRLTVLFAKPLRCLRCLWKILPYTGDWATDIIAGFIIICLMGMLADLILRMSGVI